MEIHTKNIVLQTFLNDLSFSLYAILSICYRITTLEVDWSLKEVSTEKKCITKEYLSLAFNYYCC